MTRLHRTITVSRPLQEAFDLIADFSTVEQWDPGVARARRTNGEGAGLGAEYEVVALFSGREIPMVYRTTEIESPIRVVLEGEGPAIRAVDRISFRAKDESSTQIDYIADLNLKGPSRLLQPLMRGRFQRLADAAIEGMAEFLNRSDG